MAMFPTRNFGLSGSISPNLIWSFFCSNFSCFLFLFSFFLSSLVRYIGRRMRSSSESFSSYIYSLTYLRWSTGWYDPFSRNCKPRVDLLTLFLLLLTMIFLWKWKLFGHPMMVHDLIYRDPCLCRSKYALDEIFNLLGQMFCLWDCISLSLLSKVNFIFLTLSMICLSFSPSKGGAAVTRM